MNKLYDSKYFRSSKKFQTNPKRIDILVEEIMKYRPKSVLDVGCGLGVLVNKLNDLGIPTWGIDSAEDLWELWKNKNRFKVMDAKNISFGNKAFDLVLSSDFFEHIPEEDINIVVSEMKKVGENVLAFVADDKGTILTRRQKLYHVTHKPLSWWNNKLEGIDVRSSHLCD